MDAKVRTKVIGYLRKADAELLYVDTRPDAVGNACRLVWEAWQLLSALERVARASRDDAE